MRQSSGYRHQRPDAVNAAHIVRRCRVLGPGQRFVLWVQGCPLRCGGCHNPDFLAFRDATWMKVDELARLVLETGGIEGVTFVGGEPFAQAAALARLARQIRRGGLSLMVYTGYTLGELLSGEVADAEWLLAATDLIMDGRYRQDLPTRRPWRGSDNQRLINISQRYADSVEDWNRPVGQDFEVRVRCDGSLEVLGIPPAALTGVSVVTSSRKGDG